MILIRIPGGHLNENDSHFRAGPHYVKWHGYCMRMQESCQPGGHLNANDSHSQAPDYTILLGSCQYVYVRIDCYN